MLADYHAQSDLKYIGYRSKHISQQFPVRGLDQYSRERYPLAVSDHLSRTGVIDQPTLFLSPVFFLARVCACSIRTLSKR
jgi:hypothetical protein